MAVITGNRNRYSVTGFWSLDERYQIKELYDQGLPIIYIAKIMNCSTTAITKELIRGETPEVDKNGRHGYDPELSAKKIKKIDTLDTREFIASCLRDGIATKEIAETLELTPRAIQYELKRGAVYDESEDTFAYDPYVAQVKYEKNNLDANRKRYKHKGKK